MERKKYADVWGDTVDVRHLSLAIVLGIVGSLSCYILGLSIIQSNFPQIAENLSKAYALLIGIFSSLLCACISTKLFKPKRILKEKNFSEEDRNLVLEELHIDRDKEAEALKTVEKVIIEEMKNLQLYELFSGKKE